MSLCLYYVRIFISLGYFPCLQLKHVHTIAHMTSSGGGVMNAVRPDKWKCPGRGMSWWLDLPSGMGIALQTTLSLDKWPKRNTHHILKTSNFRVDWQSLKSLKHTHTKFKIKHWGYTSCVFLNTEKFPAIKLSRFKTMYV